MSNHHNDQPHWGYESQQIGPSEWPKYYQTGKFQSPINILVDFCAITNNNSNQASHHSKHRTSSSSSSKDNRPTCCCNGSAHDLELSSQQQKLATSLRRTHLDSIGEDDHNHQRNPSASASSSASSSPVQNTDSSSCDDDYDLTRATKCTKHQRSTSKHNSSLMTTTTTTTKCVDCFPSAHHGSSAPSKGRSLVSEQNTRHCVSNKKLFLGYPRYMSNIQLCNTGHSWQINIPPELARHTLLAGPPLGDREYRLAQVHAHWGESSNHGSEHQINGKSFAAEIHFVHWNCTDFSDIEEASKHRHGLAVLGVLVMALEGEHNKNKHLDKIVSALRQVKQPNSSAELGRTKLDLKKLFPTNRWSYATYEGSLTTPPLSEVVDWIVFLNPVICSSNQIGQFQQINCDATLPMKRNCRPIQPTNNRLVSIWTHPTTTTTPN